MPCIITKETNMAEIVKDSGLVINCNANSLAEAILTMINMYPDDLKVMSSRAFNYIQPFTSVSYTHLRAHETSV